MRILLFWEIIQKIGKNNNHFVWGKFGTNFLTIFTSNGKTLTVPIHWVLHYWAHGAHHWAHWISIEWMVNRLSEALKKKKNCLPFAGNLCSTFLNWFHWRKKLIFYILVNINRNLNFHHFFNNLNTKKNLFKLKIVLRKRKNLWVNTCLKVSNGILYMAFNWLFNSFLYKQNKSFQKLFTVIICWTRWIFTITIKSINSLNLVNLCFIHYFTDIYTENKGSFA